MDPSVSVVIASERVRTLLPDCLRSLAASAGAPPFEVLVASADEDGVVDDEILWES